MPIHNTAATKNEISTAHSKDRDPVHLKSSHLPSRPPTYFPQLDSVAASTTHPDTLSQPRVQLFTIPPSPLLSSTTPLTSTETKDASSTACLPFSLLFPHLADTCVPLSTAALSLPSSSSPDINDAQPTFHLTQPAAGSTLFSSPSNICTHPLLLKESPASPVIFLPASNLTTEYFCNKIGSEATTRIDHLVRAARGFTESENLNPQPFAHYWPTHIFDGTYSGSTSRLQRLSGGLSQVNHPFASVLGSIFFAHEVEQVAAAERVKLRRGEGRLTKAFLKVGEKLAITEKGVKAWYKKSSKYRLLLQSGATGLLLYIGVGTGVESIWQHCLIKDDIDLLIKYLEECRPDLYKRARGLDKFAVQILINGMVAYGWSYSELAATSSELTECIRRHINLDQLLHKSGGSLTIAQPLNPRSEGSSNLKDESQTKRRHAGSDRTEHLSKRVRIVQEVEGLDISMMMQQAQSFDALDIASVMRPVRSFEQLDISMEMQPVQNFGPDISEMMQPVQNFESGYIRDYTDTDISRFGYFYSDPAGAATL
ncbi:hypothetical protein B0O99DRAFT_594723 [Bisporella sp. PMI_857]|nr:hypothetical protein B0O99DRAFT_594723 [Bisporella sp. PMI_857]